MSPRPGTLPPECVGVPCGDLVESVVSDFLLEPYADDRGDFAGRVVTEETVTARPCGHVITGVIYYPEETL